MCFGRLPGKQDIRAKAKKTSAGRMHVPTCSTALVQLFDPPRFSSTVAFTAHCVCWISDPNSTLRSPCPKHDSILPSRDCTTTFKTAKWLTNRSKI